MGIQRSSAPQQAPAVDRLASADPDVQRAAALELAESGDDSALPALTQAFHTENWLVRGACVRAIIAIGGGPALGAFSTALHEGDARIRAAAIEIFRGLGRHAVDPLSQLLKDADTNVVRYAAELLGEIGDPGAGPAVLEAAQSHTDENVRYQGYLTLGKLGYRAAIPQLREALGASLWVQTAALEAIAALAAEELEPDLLALVHKTEVWALPTVLDALGCVGTQSAVEPLYQFIVSDEELSLHSLRALVRVLAKPKVSRQFEGRERDNILGVARRAIASSDPELRRAGIDMAGRLADEESIGLLIPLLDTDSDADESGELLDEEEAAAAAQALMSIGAAVEEALVAAFTGLEAAGQILAMDVLGHVGSVRSGKLLVQLLDHEDVEINRAACDALGRIGDPRFADALIFQFQHPFASVRSAAQRALSRFPREVITPKLRPLLSDPLSDVRAMAASTLGALQVQDAAGELKHLLVDPDNLVKQAAVFALAALEERQVGSLPLLLMGNNDPVLRRSSAQVVGQLRDRRAVEPLVYLLQFDEDMWVRFQAARALGEIGMGESRDARAVEPMLDRLNDDVGLVRVAAAEALVRLTGEEYRDRLLPMAEDPDPDVRRALVRLLGSNEVDGVGKILVRAMRDTAWKVRYAALVEAARRPDDEVLLAFRDLVRDEHELVRQRASELIEDVERRVGIGA
ncbi:MAG: HEAT repeat domain-containing protein [Chrysiogenetes bacterium]|nr:HEAT repeat domain-containing protein [Chrysiogenetes bacterium]